MASFAVSQRARRAQIYSVPGSSRSSLRWNMRTGLDTQVTGKLTATGRLPDPTHWARPEQ